MIESGQAATTGADLDEVNGWHRYGETRTLLEAVHTGHFKRVGQRRLAVDDEACLGGGPTHVEAQQTILTEATGEPTPGKGARRRSGFNQTDRCVRRILGRHHAPI